MAYGSKSSDIKDSSNLGTGIHEVVLAEAKAQTVTTAKGDFEVLDYVFKNINGDQFQYRIFNPETSTKVEKAEKDASDKVVYIASKVSGKEKELPAVESWNEFTETAISLLPKDYNKVPLSIKLIGNVYNGKANVQTNNLYNGGWIGGGWLERKDSGKVLVLSVQDKKSIAEYEAFLMEKPKSKVEPEFTGATEAEGDFTEF